MEQQPQSENQSSVQATLPFIVERRAVYPGALIAALAEAQKEIFNPGKSRKVSFEGRDGRAGRSYEYAELCTVLDIIREPCAKNGLAVIQTVIYGKDGPYVLTAIAHASGDAIEFRYPMIVEETQRMKSDQSFAAAFTYAKRQALKGIFAIADDSEDLDGHDGNDKVTVGPKEASQSAQKARVSTAAEPKPKVYPPSPQASGASARNLEYPSTTERGVEWRNTPAPDPKAKITTETLNEITRTYKASKYPWTPELMKAFTNQAFGVESAQDLTNENAKVLKAALSMSYEHAVKAFAGIQTAKKDSTLNSSYAEVKL